MTMTAASPSDIEARTIAVVAEVLRMVPAAITRESEMDVLGANSLDQIEIVMALEEEFRVEIPDDDVQHFQTVADVITLAEHVAK